MNIIAPVLATMALVVFTSAITISNLTRTTMIPLTKMTPTNILMSYKMATTVTARTKMTGRLIECPT